MKTHEDNQNQLWVARDKGDNLYLMAIEGKKIPETIIWSTVKLLLPKDLFPEVGRDPQRVELKLMDK